MSMMTQAFEMAEFDRLLRTKLNLFSKRCFIELNPGKDHVDEPHQAAVAYQLECMLAGVNKRYIATLPPRAGKTELISIAFVAFALMLKPSLRIILTTYAGDLAEEYMFKIERVMTSSWYRRLAPKTVLLSANKKEIKTSQNGGILALGMSGALTGRGADIIIVDDIMKAIDTQSAAIRETAKRFFAEVLYSRLDSKAEGMIVIAQQRLHPDDLIGAELEKGGWNHQNFSAIAQEDEQFPLGGGKYFRRKRGEALSPREGLASLEETRKRMGTAAFLTQYIGLPQPAEGNMIKREWIQRWKRLPDRSEAKVVISIDTAGKGNPKSDYSAATVWMHRGDDHFVIDAMQERLDFVELRDRVYMLNEKHRPDIILIEDHQLGTALGDDLRKRWHINAKLIRPKGDKAGRLAIVLPIFEKKSIWLPDEEFPWVEVLFAEWLAFPNVRHDDFVDSTTLYLNWVRGGGHGDFSYSFVGRYDAPQEGEPIWDVISSANCLRPPHLRI